MRHRVKGNNLNRDSAHRRALNKFMATSFIEKGHMTTTVTKAKVLKPFIEKLVTKAKTNNLITVKHLKANLTTRTAIDELLNTVGPKFSQRPGGYIRIVKLGSRDGDNAPLAKLEWVEDMKAEDSSKSNKVSKVSKAADIAKPKKTRKKSEVSESESVEDTKE